MVIGLLKSEDESKSGENIFELFWLEALYSSKFSSFFVIIGTNKLRFKGKKDSFDEVQIG